MSLGVQQRLAALSLRLSWAALDVWMVTVLIYLIHHFKFSSLLFWMLRSTTCRSPHYTASEQKISCIQKTLNHLMCADSSLNIIFFFKYVMCHVSRVMWHVTCAMCHLSSVTCHLSPTLPCLLSNLSLVKPALLLNCLQSEVHQLNDVIDL